MKPRSIFIVLLVCACAGQDDVVGGQGPTSSGSAGPTGSEPSDPDPSQSTSLEAVPTTGGATTGGATTDGAGGATETGVPPSACGDGVIDPPVEECDEGAQNDAHAACTPSCRFNVCGDGFVYAGVEACDDGPANVDTGYCRSDCQLGVCGDGFLYAQLEECDAGAGNGPAYGGCDADCTINRCGDGQLDVGFEECDLGPDNGSGRGVEPGVTGCDLSCGLDGRRIFLSSQLFTGDMGTRAGADLACQNMATQADFRFPKRFRALLADATGAPADYVEEDPGGRPFILPSGLIIAADFASLIDAGPGPGITTTETGEVLFKKPVWTNLNPFGAPYLLDPEHSCMNWTSANDLKFTRRGRNAVAPGDPAYTQWQAERHWLSFAASPCNEAYRVYCIEAKAD